jgi:hypothetical protein
VTYNPKYICTDTCDDHDFWGDTPHLTCGCGLDDPIPDYPKTRFWFYRPSWYFYRFSPVWFGNDEWNRKTIVLGWNVTGQLVIALWTFKEHRNG